MITQETDDNAIELKVTLKGFSDEEIGNILLSPLLDNKTEENDND